MPNGSVVRGYILRIHVADLTPKYGRRRGCSLETPHPFPALVAHLTEALKQLRAAALDQSGNKMGSRTLWRGVRQLASNKPHTRVSWNRISDPSEPQTRLSWKRAADPPQLGVSAGRG